jgi:hypothetical protein
MPLLKTVSISDIEALSDQMQAAIRGGQLLLSVPVSEGADCPLEGLGVDSSAANQSVVQTDEG